MKDYKRLSHVVYDFKYHIVWCPKYRFQILKGDIGRTVRDIIRQLCDWKDIEIFEGRVMIDHIHLVASIPPKYGVSEDIMLVRSIWMKRPFREYVRNQMKKDYQEEQLELWKKRK